MPVRSTGLGHLVAGAAWTAFLAGFLLGSLAPALVGLVLLGLRHATRGQLRDVRAQGRRRLPRRTALLEEFDATVEVRLDHDLPVRVEDEVPDAIQVLARRATPGRGHAREDLVLRARDPGRAPWTHLRLSLEDPWGLHTEERRLAVPDETAVVPEARWAAHGRRLRRTVSDARVRRRLAIEPLPEVVGVRDWQAGDRARDIDWPRTSRLGRMISRVHERAIPRPMLVLLDARPSMRWRRRHAKLTPASRLAYALAATASTTGVRTHLVAFGDEGVLATRATGDKRLLEESLQRLTQIAAPRTVKELPALPRQGRAPTDADRAFLKALAPLIHGPAPAAPPLEAALAFLTHGTTQPATVAAILDAEIDPDGAEAAVRRLRAHGHKVILIVPATGPHHIRRHEARDAGPHQDVARRTFRTRQALTQRLIRLHVPLLPLRPGEELHVLQEAARWAR